MSIIFNILIFLKIAHQVYSGNLCGMENKSRKEKKEFAMQLFLSTDLTQKMIAQIVGVTEKTVGNWISKDDGAWKKLKVARTVTKQNVIANAYRQLMELDKTIAERDERNYPTSAEADIQAKIATKIDKLERQYNLSTYYTVFEEFTKYLMSVDTEAAKSLIDFMLEFLKMKAGEIKSKK